MGHVVRYRSPAGEERVEDHADLDAALQRVEHLRNEEGVREVRLYREVPLEFRTYVRATIADAQSAAAPRPEAVATVRDQPGRDQESDRDAATAGATAGAPQASTEQSTRPSGAPSQPPPGAMPIPPPHGEQPDAEQPDGRKISLFSRGQAS